MTVEQGKYEELEPKKGPPTKAEESDSNGFDEYGVSVHERLIADEATDTIYEVRGSRVEQVPIEKFYVQPDFLVQTIWQLPKNRAAVAYKKIYLGLSNEQIAAQMKISVKMVDKVYQSARIDI